MLIANAAALRKPGLGVGDTGAGLVGMGEETLKAWEKWLTARGMRFSWEADGAKTEFRFGNSQSARALGTVWLPIGLRGAGLWCCGSTSCQEELPS